MDNEYTVDGPYYSLTLKLNAKGESSGEYTVKSHTYDDLVKKNEEAKALLLKSL